MNRISHSGAIFFKKIFLIAIIFQTSVSTVWSQNFTLQGSSTANGSNCFILTPNQTDKNGSAWFSQKIDLKYNFDINYSVNLGTNPSGADGMAFVLQSVSNTITGSSGSGMGYGGIAPSLDLEYDTYPNTDYQAYDPNYDHICLMKNGEFHHNVGQLVPYVPLTNSSNGSVKDGKNHICRTTWDVASQTITVYFDGIQKLTYTGDIINNIFSGNSGVYFGFTASTGGLSNQHSACVDLSGSSFQLLAPFDIQITSNNATCAGNGTDGNAAVTFSGGVTPYTFDGWTYPNGSTNSSASITNLTAGTYTATAHDGSGTVITKSVQITGPVVPVISGAGPLQQYLTSSCSVVGNYYGNGKPLTILNATNINYVLSGATTGSGSGTGTDQLFNSGITNVTITAQNSCITAIANFTVTVIDNTAPVINNMPANISIKNDPGKCGAVVAFYPPPPGPVLDQINTDQSTGTVGADQWQSFTAGKTGLLTQIDLFHNGCQQTDFTFTIYSGVGTNGSVLYSAPYNYGYFCSNWFGIVIPSQFQPNVIAGQTYTFRLQGNGTGFVAGSGSNQGTYYSSSYGSPGWKLDFKSYVQVGSNVPTATDNCGTATLISDHLSGDFFPVGNTLVTYKATDGAGNVTTSSFNVAVTDNEKPNVITKPVTLYLVNGTASLTPEMIDNGSTDNCSISSISISKSVFDCTNKGNNIDTLTVVDVNGNSSSATANVTVVDGSAPIPTFATLPVITGECSAAVNTTPTAVDGCGILITATTTDPLVYNNQGTFTINWKFTSANGNTSTQTQQVFIHDDISPVAPILADLSGECQVIAIPPIAIDNCSGNVTGTTSDPLSYSAQGNYIIHWTFTDAVGNTSTALQNVIITDITKPIFNNVADISVYATSNSGAIVNYTAPSAIDNCTLVSNILTGGFSSGSTFPIGTSTVTYTATDEAGLTASTSFHVNVLGVSPTLISPANIITVNDMGKCGAVVSFTAVDSTGIPASSINYSVPSGSLFPIGTTTVTATATNAVGSSSKSFNVTVTDTEVPAFTNALLPLTFNTNIGKCGASIILPNPNVTDNCGVASVTSDAPLNFPTGSTVVHWIATDINGNINSASQTITVIDTAKPVITAPADVTVHTDQGVNYASNVNIGTAIASDNCNILSTTNDAPSIFPFGTTLVNWKTTDVNGNTTSIIQKINVIDTEAPVAVVSSSVNKVNDPGICGAVVNYPAVFVTDNVSTTSMTISNGDADGTITFATPILNNVNGINFIAQGNYTDIAHGHGKNISVLIELFNPLTNNWIPIQTIQTGVGDFHFGGKSYNFPVISKVSQIRFTASEYIGAAFHLYLLKLNLNSIKLLQTSGLPSGSVCPVGTTVNNFQTIDESGNSTTSTFTVTITDAEKPVISRYQSSTQSLTSNCSWSGSAGSITISDNCPADLMLTENDIDAQGNIIYNGQYSIHQGSISLPPRNYPLGINTVQLYAVDAAGNQSLTVTFTVTIIDLIKPTIVASGDITKNTNSGVCRAFVRVPVPTVSDNCAVQSFTNSYNGTPNATDNYPVGTTLITWTVTDGSGNTSTTTQSITVVDLEPPFIINVPQNIIQTNDAGNCGAIVTWPPLISTDNCAVQSFISDHQSGELFPIGVTTVSFTATDIHNNISTASFTITITDNEAPIVNVKPITVTLRNGSASIIASQLDNGSRDNCGAVSFSASKTLFTCNDIGVNQVTLTVTDKYGNAAATTTPVTVIGEVPTSSIILTPGNNIFTGGIASNLYLGYGPQNVTLKDTVSGISSLTYSWSGSSALSCQTCQVPVLTPINAGQYNLRVTATNTFGCSTTSTASICVRDIRVPAVAGNVYVCHTDISTGIMQTLSLPTNSVTTDLSTYPQDVLGSCGMQPCSSVGILNSALVDTNQISNVPIEVKKDKLILQPLIVRAYPNPSQDVFNLIITSNSLKTLTVKVTDVNGKVLQEINDATPNNILRIGGNLTAGVYFVQVMQGDQIITLKLLKMK